MRPYITLLFLVSTLLAQAQISGKVVSERGETLPGALVLLLPDSASSITDASGVFVFSNLRPGRYALEVSFLGFDTWRRELTLERKPLRIEAVLSSRDQLLETVVVSADHAKQESTSRSILSPSSAAAPWPNP